MAHRVRIATIAVSAALVGIGGGIGVADAADYIPEPVYVEQPMIEYAPPAYYARVDCAASFNETTNLRVGRPEMHFIEKNGGSLHTDVGWACGLGVGVYINTSLRADVTMEYRGGYAFDGVADPNFPVPPPDTPLSQSGHIDSFVTLFNGYWDIGTWHGVTPYLGAGIGFAYHDMSDVHIRESGFRTIGRDDTSIAWAVMAGLAIDISPDVVLDANYRFIDTGQIASSTVGSDGSTGLPPIIAKNMEAHEIRVGVRYSFP